MVRKKTLSKDCHDVFSIKKKCRLGFKVYTFGLALGFRPFATQGYFRETWPHSTGSYFGPTYQPHLHPICEQP